MLVPSCPTMHRARPTLLLPLLLVLGLFLHLADAQSKWTTGFHLRPPVFVSCLVRGGAATMDLFVVLLLHNTIT